MKKKLIFVIFIIYNFTIIANNCSQKDALSPNSNIVSLIIYYFPKSEREKFKSKTGIISLLVKLVEEKIIKPKEINIKEEQIPQKTERKHQKVINQVITKEEINIYTSILNKVNIESTEKNINLIHQMVLGWVKYDNKDDPEKSKSYVVDWLCKNKPYSYKGNVYCIIDKLYQLNLLDNEEYLKIFCEICSITFQNNFNGIAILDLIQENAIIHRFKSGKPKEEFLLVNSFEGLQKLKDIIQRLALYGVDPNKELKSIIRAISHFSINSTDELFKIEKLILDINNRNFNEWGDKFTIKDYGIRYKDYFKYLQLLEGLKLDVTISNIVNLHRMMMPVLLKNNEKDREEVREKYLDEFWHADEFYLREEYTSKMYRMKSAGLMQDNTWLQELSDIAVICGGNDIFYKMYSETVITRRRENQYENINLFQGIEDLKVLKAIVQRCKISKIDPIKEYEKISLLCKINYNFNRLKDFEEVEDLIHKINERISNEWGDKLTIKDYGIRYLDYLKYSQLLDGLKLDVTISNIVNLHRMMMSVLLKNNEKDREEVREKYLDEFWHADEFYLREEYRSTMYRMKLSGLVLNDNWLQELSDIAVICDGISILRDIDNMSTIRRHVNDKYEEIKVFKNIEDIQAIKLILKRSIDNGIDVQEEIREIKRLIENNSDMNQIKDLLTREQLLQVVNEKIAKEWENKLNSEYYTLTYDDFIAYQNVINAIKLSDSVENLFYIHRIILASVYCAEEKNRKETRKNIIDTFCYRNGYPYKPEYYGIFYALKGNGLLDNTDNLKDISDIVVSKHYNSFNVVHLLKTLMENKNIFENDPDGIKKIGSFLFLLDDFNSKLTEWHNLKSIFELYKVAIQDDWNDFFSGLVYFVKEAPNRLEDMFDLIFKEAKKTKHGLSTNVVLNLSVEIIINKVSSYVNNFERLFAEENVAGSYVDVFNAFLLNNKISTGVKFDIVEIYIELIGLKNIGQNIDEKSERFISFISSIDTLIKYTIDEIKESNENETIINIQKIKKKLLNIRKQYLKLLINKDLKEENLEDLFTSIYGKRIFTFIKICILVESSKSFKEGLILRKLLKYVLITFFDNYDSEIENFSERIQIAEDAVMNKIISLDKKILNDDIFLSKNSLLDSTNADIMKMNGYNPLLWTEGILTTMKLNEAISNEQKINMILFAAYELVEIAILKIKINEINGIPLKQDYYKTISSYDNAAKFVNDVLKQQELFDKYEERIDDILAFIKRTDNIPITKVKPIQVNGVIRKNIFSEGSAGIGVPGCYAPNGLHNEKPLIVALEGNSFFMQVFNNDNQIGNAEIILGEQGAYVYSGYNHSAYNIEKVYAETLKILSKNVPAIILTESSAGFTELKKYAKKINIPITIRKPATIFSYQYFDWGDVDDAGNLSINLNSYYLITEELIREKGGFNTNNIEINWSDLFYKLKPHGKEYLFIISQLKNEIIKNAAFTPDHKWVRNILLPYTDKNPTILENVDILVDILNKFIDEQPQEERNKAIAIAKLLNKLEIHMTNLSKTQKNIFSIIIEIQNIIEKENIEKLFSNEELYLIAETIFKVFFNNNQIIDNTSFSVADKAA